eukprot:6460339-Amphidinium_carterae.1
MHRCVRCPYVCANVAGTLDIASSELFVMQTDAATEAEVPLRKAGCTSATHMPVVEKHVSE